MKVIALISGIIFLAIIIVAVTLVYNLSIPIVKKIQTSASIEKMKTTLLELDNIIRKVSLEGNGSKRTKTLKINEGKLVADADKDMLYYEIITNARIISPRTMQTMGNLIFGSNLETSAKEGNYSNTSAFILENKHLIIYIKKIGSEKSPQYYNTSNLLLAVFQKDLSQYIPLKTLEISIDSNPDSESGMGYTLLEKESDNLPYGKVIAFMNSSYLNYSIEFILESGADFIEIKGNKI